MFIIYSNFLLATRTPSDTLLFGPLFTYQGDDGNRVCVVTAEVPLLVLPLPILLTGFVLESPKFCAGDNPGPPVLLTGFGLVNKSVALSDF